MPSKAPIQRTGPPPATTISGKWLIIGVVTVALIGAVGSWVFRFYATHRIAQYWGPTNARLIRDAPEVTLERVKPGSGAGETKETFDMSQAHGLAHLRNALLENQGYNWTTSNTSTTDGHWFLMFRDPSIGRVDVAFSEDCRSCWMFSEESRSPSLSCEPIAAGLLTIFTEVANAPSNAGTSR
jgi:hypothetical protein